MQNLYTVGMAGHIDHGKTTLTKALTGVETDRLKEEKERKISIEPGFAALVQTETEQISIIDVPGHERFIRQMIAGVAGIDVVVLVVAADEGVMPQTEEHLHILSLLGIERGVVVITKSSLVDQSFLEMVEEDIKETTKGTFLERAPIYSVDSLTGEGIDFFKKELIRLVTQEERRKSYASFRLPIDHVFTVKGQGVVVRGTIFDGQVQVGDELTLLPNHHQVRVRQIQSHHKQTEVAYAGQRTALNLGGISHDLIRRGDVLVEDDFYVLTNRLDLVLETIDTFKHPLKQRTQIKFYVGTSEVTGRIIFFDRNELNQKESDEVLCQAELDDPVVVTRGDRFVIRRASPIETVGGGWIMNPNAKKYRFGEATIKALKEVKEGSPVERIFRVLKEAKALSEEELLRLASLNEAEFKLMKDQLIAIGNLYTKESVLITLIDQLTTRLQTYHNHYPLRAGINKAELISSFKKEYPERLIEYALTSPEAKGLISLEEQTVKLSHFKRQYPPAWKKRIEGMLEEWEEAGAEVEKMEAYFQKHQIDQALYGDLYHFLIQTQEAYEFDEGRLIAQSVINHLKEKLYQATEGQSFTLQRAREVLGLSRKNLVPLLELFDRLSFTKRIENERIWQ